MKNISKHFNDKKVVQNGCYRFMKGKSCLSNKALYDEMRMT